MSPRAVKILVALALALLLAAVARASGPDIDTGNYLLLACSEAMRVIDGEKNEQPDLVEANYCFGFVRASYRAVEFLEVYDPDAGICTPSSMSGSQAVRIVVKYLKANPERLSEEPFRLVVRAFTAAYPGPCREQQ